MDAGHENSRGVEEACLAADAAEGDAVTAYLRRHSLLAVVVEAVRRAEAVARLEAALRLAL